ncbi:MAG: NAD(P)/FAD-dependent oxidoreductase [Bacteroidota bacterium]
MSEKVAIVGGGILGMTAALRIAEKGYQVELFDAAPELGGLARSWKIDNITWDKFYHVVLLSDTYTRKIISEIGLENKFNWVETKTGFYSGGKLYSMSNLLEFFKFPPINLVDKCRLGFTIFAASRIRNWKKLERIPVEKWLTGLSGKRTFNKIWLPLLKAKLGDSYKETAASFIWATIQRMYAARRTGLKKEMFGYVEGGYDTVLNAFEKHIQDNNVTIHKGYKAEVVQKGKNGVSIKFGNGKVRTFHKVVMTTPSPIITKTVVGLSESEISKLNATEYLGVVCTSLLLKNPISPYYVTNITDDIAPFTGIIEMSSLVDKKNFNGHSLIYLPKYVKASNPFFAKTDEEIEKNFIDALARMYPHITVDEVIASKTARTPFVFALPKIGYSESLSPMKTSIPGLFCINSSYITNATLNVNDTIKLAEESVSNFF